METKTATFDKTLSNSFDKNYYKQKKYILTTYKEIIFDKTCNKFRMISDRVDSKKQKQPQDRLVKLKNKHSFHLEVCELVHDFSEQNLLFVAVALHTKIL
jgi:hypothetical protein